MSLQSRTMYLQGRCIGTHQPSAALDSGSVESSSRMSIVNEAGEEVLNLHKKLQVETENIIRWKASTEVNTKQLELQLEETQGTVTDLRRNLVELQMTNENLSQNLIKEREERKLVNAKVVHTRNLLTSLQQQCQELEGTMGVLNQEKEYHFSMHSNTIESIDQLSRSFKDLSVISEQQLKVITDKAQEEILSLEKHKVSLENGLEKKMSENTQLTKSLEEQKGEVAELTEKLDDTRSLAKEAEEKCTQLKVELVEAQEGLSKVTSELEGQVTDNLQIKTQLTEEQYKLKESQSEFREAVDKIKFLKNSNDILEGANSELTEKLNAVTNQKAELEKDGHQKEHIIEKLQSDNNKLYAEIQEVNCCLETVSTELEKKDEKYKALQEENGNLISQVEKIEVQLTEEQDNRKLLESKLSKTTESLEEHKKTVEKLNEDQKNLLDDKTNLEQRLQQKEAEIQDKVLEIESLVQKISDATKLEENLQETNLSLQNELNDARKEKEQQLQALIEDGKNKVEGFAKTEADLKDKVNFLENQFKNERLNAESEKKALQNLLQEKEASALSDHKKFTDKIAELEKQLDITRDDLNALTNSSKKEFDEMTSRVAEEEGRLKEEKDNLETEVKKTSKNLANLQLKHEKVTEELKSVKSQIKEHEKDVKAKTKKIQQEEKKVEKLEKSVKELQSSLEMMREKNSGLEEECLKYKKDLDDNEQVKEKNQETYAEERKLLEADLLKETREREHLEEQLKERRQEFVAFQDSTNDKIQKINEEMQKLINDHKTQVDALEAEKEKLCQDKLEFEKQMSQKLHLVEAEADEKIKSMAEFLARYKSDYEAKLLEAELKLREMQSKCQSESCVEMKYADIGQHCDISVLTTPKQYSSLTTASKIGAQEFSTPSQNSDGIRKSALKMQKISTAHTEVSDETPSPSQYLAAEPFLFKQPEAPKSLDKKYSGQKKLNSTEGNKGETGILKNKRTLLPSSTQKHVMFKLPSPCINSGDSSSDICTFDVIDSDDAFDEVMRSGKYRSILKPKSMVKPQANVPPMRHSAFSIEEARKNQFESQRLPLSQNSTGQAPLHKKERTTPRNKKRKKEVKTYVAKKSPGIENVTPSKE